MSEKISYSNLAEYLKVLGIDEIFLERPIKLDTEIDLDNILFGTPQERHVNIMDLSIKQAPSTKAEIEAEQLANKVNTLADLREAVTNYKALDICKTAKNTVFGEGNVDSDVMFIGEAPGATEDAQGVPFCGESGKLLDQMLSYVGLSRHLNIYISNIVFWRPPGNRKPTPLEIKACMPFVRKHIALFKPKLLVMVGATATTLIDAKEGITKLRAQEHIYNCPISGNIIDARVIFHPSYLLRQPGQKKYAWQDMLKIKQFLIQNSIIE